MASLTFLTQGLQTALTTGPDAVFSPSFCFYSLAPMQSLLFPPGDQFCVITPQSLKVTERTFGGGLGKVNWLVQWRAMVYVFVRLGLDEEHRDTQYLLDQTYGSLVLTDQVIDTLQNYRLNDPGTGNYFGYQLDEIKWELKSINSKGWVAKAASQQDRDAVGWATTQIYVHTDLTGRAQ